MMNLAAVLLTLVIPAAGADGRQPPPPRDTRSGRVKVEADSAEVDLKKRIAESPADVAAYLTLAHLQEDRGAYADAEATLARARDVASRDKRVYTAIAAYFNRRGDFEQTIKALEMVAQLTPTDAAGHQVLATYYWEKAFKDKELTPAQRWTYIFEGISATDRALAINPDYVESLTYKNILLRLRAQQETDPEQQKATVAEADRLRARAIEITKSGQGLPAVAGPPPPPPPPLPTAPVRVGGGIQAPTKIKHVSPIYPPDAQMALISGVVIIEATLGTDGRVVDAKILRSIPLLDQAALDAVRQWEFTATYLNGVPVPVIMTVTVNFTLM